MLDRIFAASSIFFLIGTLVFLIGIFLLPGSVSRYFTGSAC